jgi:hypothetical protein
MEKEKYRVDGKGYFVLVFDEQEGGYVLTFIATDHFGDEPSMEGSPESHFMFGKDFLNLIKKKPLSVSQDEIIVYNIYVDHYETNLSLNIIESGEAFLFGGTDYFGVDENMFLELCEENEVVVEYTYEKDLERALHGKLQYKD